MNLANRTSHKHKFVFIAVPKTASLVIRDMLDKNSCVKYGNFNGRNPHITASQVKKELFANDTKKFNSYFKFAF